MAGSFTDYTEDLVLKWLFTTGTAARPTSWYVGLFTAAPGETGGGTEVSGGAYARQSAAFSVSGDDPTAATTSGAIEFPVATADWGEVTHAAVFDAATGGDMIAYAELTVPKTIGSGDILRIAAGKLTITLD
jgi:hypothetical protein